MKIYKAGDIVDIKVCFSFVDVSEEMTKHAHTLAILSFLFLLSFAQQKPKTVAEYSLVLSTNHTKNIASVPFF